MRRGNIQVLIKSEGRILPEYQVETLDGGKTVACYIPSEVGKNFEICWRGDTHLDPYDTSVRCDVDGRKAGGSYCERGVLNGSRWGIRETPDLRRPFVFAPLVTTDDDDVAAGPEAQPDLGSIEVRLAYAVRMGRANFKSSQLFQPGTVHERSKKMGVQCVSLGNGRRCDPHHKTHIRLIEGPNSLYARFVFRYRSKDFLQAEGIMPYDEEVPAPPATGRKRRASRSQADAPEAGPRRKRARATPADSDATPQAASQADVKPSAAELAANDGADRPRELRSSRRAKSERQGPDEGVIDLTEGEVKREHSPIRLPAAHIGGIIDLTSDDE